MICSLYQPLMVAVMRRTLFTERRNPFLEIFGLKKHHLLAIFKHERRLEAWRIDLHVQSLFGHAKTHRRCAEHIGGKFKGPVEKVFFWYDVADKTNRFGSFGLHKSAGHQHLGSNGKTDKTR